MQTMQVSTEKSGDYRTVRIPEEFFREMEIPENDSVHISFMNQSIVITKEKFMTVEDYVEEFYGVSWEEVLKNPEKFHVEQKVIDWGPPVGHEIW